MRNVSLNLASRPLRNQLLPGILLTVLAVGALLFTVFNVVGYTTNARAAREVSRQIAQRREKIETLGRQRESLRRQLARLDLEDMGSRSQLANGLLLRRGLRWTRLFNELEAVQPYHVRLYSVRPSVGKEGVRLLVNGAAQSIDDELEYIDRLETSDLFLHVYPRSETPDKGGVRFTLQMQYYPERAVADDAALEAGGTPAGETASEPAPAVSTPENAPAEPAPEPARSVPADPAAAGREEGRS